MNYRSQKYFYICCISEREAEDDVVVIEIISEVTCIVPDFAFFVFIDYEATSQ